MNEAQQALLQRFAEACEADNRIVAAFLGGSFAGGTADAYSDLDIYLVTSDDAYDAFFADRQAFMQRLGQPVFLEDFNDFGFDMLLFTFADGVEGELALGRESNFDHIHGGPYKVLVDKKGLLTGKTFPLFHLTEEDQLKTLRHTIYWFWESVSHFAAAMGRRQLWTAYGSLEEMRRECLRLLRLQHDFTAVALSYFKVEKALPKSKLLPLKATFCPLETEPMLQSALTILEVYRQVASSLAAKYGNTYPADLDRVISTRLDEFGRSLRGM